MIEYYVLGGLAVGGALAIASNIYSEYQIKKLHKACNEHHEACVKLSKPENISKLTKVLRDGFTDEELVLFKEKLEK